MLLTTQYLEEADRLADRIAVIDAGRVVAEGTAAELKRQVADHRLELEAATARRTTNSPNASATAPRASIRAALTISLADDGGAGDIRAQLDELDPDRVRIARFAGPRASLDDVFLALTGNGGLPMSEIALVADARTPRRPLAAPLAAQRRRLHHGAGAADPMLMLMFVYLFGGAIHTGTRYVDYVVPGRAPGVRRIRRRARPRSASPTT